MRKYFFYIVAVVLSLGIMTSTFAIGLKAIINPVQDEIHYYDFDGLEPNPESGWSNVNNWTSSPPSSGCPTGDDTICRINLSSGQTLSAVLGSVSSLSELMSKDEADLRSSP